ncbi:hypothetical protein [Secundilactobacillus silagei]|uniref:hypothetical protein n=1 Tax=Secundilactobacillus silagei TaxID=1293415 RepID=UPI0006D03913|nr:hypothetical protein [Secundilactobacillus silagei]
MTIGLLILSLVAQPVWWAGLIREWWIADKRIKRERLTFGSAVYSDKYEVRHFVLYSVFLGLIFFNRLVCFGHDCAYQLVGLLHRFGVDCDDYRSGGATSNDPFCRIRGIV